MRRQACGGRQGEILRKRTRPDKHLRCQPRCRLGHTFFTSFIAIEDEQYSTPLTNRLDNEALLCFRERAAHDGHDILTALLPERKNAAKETFYHYEAFASVLPGAMEIVQHQRLPKVGREFVFGLILGWGITRPAAGIRDELPVFVMNGDDDAAVHDAAAVMVPKAKRGNRLFSQSLLHQIGMRRVEVLEGECERLVRW